MTEHIELIVKGLIVKGLGIGAKSAILHAMREGQQSLRARTDALPRGNLRWP